MSNTHSLYYVRIWKARHIGQHAAQADILQRVQASDPTQAMSAVMRFYGVTFAHIVVVTPSSSPQGYESWYDVTCPPPVVPAGRREVRA